MGLFQQYNSCVSCPSDILKLYIDSKSHLHNPEFSGYNGMKFKKYKKGKQHFGNESVQSEKVTVKIKLTNKASTGSNI